MPKKKRVSLSSELHLTMDAINGVRSLTKQWIDSFGMDTRLPDQIRALLAVVTERVRLMDRVVRGTVEEVRPEVLEVEGERLMTEWVEAVEQTELPHAWDEPAPQLPMDHAAIFSTTVPLLSLALVFGIALVRSLP